MSTESAPDLSIIIVSFNTVQHLGRCLASLRTNRPRVPCEIIVIDNASADGSPEMVEAEFPECRLIRAGTNEGYGVAINRAVSFAAGLRYLLFLNPDMEVPRGSLDTLIEFAQAHPKAGVVGPRLLLGNGEPQASGRRLLSPFWLLLEASRLPLLLPSRLRGRLMAGTYDQQNRTETFGWICGACHLIPRHTWNAIGPLTEETFCGFDDYDYCARAWRRGFEVWLCAEASMIHHCSVAVRQRWTSWEVELLATHNTYVVLASHWPRWRVRSYLLAELVVHLSEIARNALVPRRGLVTVDESYGARCRRRAALIWSFLVGAQSPMRRFQVKHSGPSVSEATVAPV